MGDLYMLNPNDLDQIMTELRSYLPFLAEKYGIRSMGVFGSYARREEKTDSDIDESKCGHTTRRSPTRGRSREDRNCYCGRPLAGSYPRVNGFSKSVLFLSRAIGIVGSYVENERRQTDKGRDSFIT
jgi:hypothetical protein